MIKFEIGKEYATRSVCNSECIFKIKVIKRTDKTVTVDEDGEVSRKKIYMDDNCEYIKLGNYSMAPIIHAKEQTNNNTEVKELAEPKSSIESEIISLLSEVDRKYIINTLISFGCDKQEVYANAFNIEKLSNMFLNISKKNIIDFYMMAFQLAEHIK
jgi:hypothetical protein